MNLVKVQQALRTFIRQHHSRFQTLAKTETQVLEVGALLLAVEHYKRVGYGIAVVNAPAGRFRVKLTARGHPWNFSWYEVKRGEMKFEVHGNLAVQSAWAEDEGIYVVDVGIAMAGMLPTTHKDRKVWAGMPNDQVVTFIEAKKLVVYPMLLAQFVGIVHEIKPSFLGAAPDFSLEKHFCPALVSIGYLTATSKSIINGYVQRRFGIRVVPAFDLEVLRLSQDAAAPSPLA